MLEELNQIHASEELIQETLQYCKDNKSTAYKASRKVKR